MTFSGDPVATGREDPVVRLNQQAERLRMRLAKLRQNLAQVQRDFNDSHAAQLKEANEKLVLAALHADTNAESAISDLDQLLRVSQRDALTGMPNRALILDRLDSAIAAARRHGTRFAVVFLDLDHFKPINDTLGHAGGDEVLQCVAQRLQSIVRDSDTVSRYGGDEFLVLLNDVSQPSDAALLAGKMLSALTAPIPVDDRLFHVSGSVGITLYPEDGENATTLINRADAAMYRAKRAGGGSFEFHRGDLAEQFPQQPGAAELQLSRRREPDGDDPTPAEHHLREANEQLTLAALNAQASESEARQAHHRQIKFTAMVAHELRNPLAPIQIAADLLASGRADGEMSPEQLKLIIEGQVTHLSRLIDDLLEGSRVGTDKLRLECRMVDLVEVLAGSVATCQPSMNTRKQRLEVNMPNGPLHFYGDPVRLTQVFSNLLDNASKYTPAGGHIALTLQASPDSATATVTVADDGAGIAPELLPGIFDLFVQDTDAIEPAFGGLGIGLAVVRDLVEAHGGHVVGRSAGRNLGSEFVVTLPLWLRSPAMRKA
ncbi:diguanylate cyclase domain-containing protein [Rhodanobacter umsongensis]|uniref:histidine kinase n=1 Tax=Rhodanobacter umsongensis TaxID=633153 RepID=A0ABW0JHF8_9GAMM